MPITRTVSVACAALALTPLAACASGESEPTVATYSAATTTVESVPQDAAFEGANPCDLLTSDETEAATGIPGLTGEWQPNEDSTIIGCNWGDGPGSISAAMSVGVDTRFLTIGRTLDTMDGHEIKIEQADETSCGLAVTFGGDRLLLLGFVPTARQIKSEKNPTEEMWCDRTLTLVKAALPRLGWQ
ncbi:DUF3558 family protein [Rhodococcus sp. NPDC058514]|uniref:DUF3558 family protein n=1 Tax=unclassified Rhodococcus (in: high G+C Gram-positive bacteria) TaxID=192944 RepID=UPI003663AE64